MKSRIYKLFTLAAASAALISCGGDPSMEISTEKVTLDGENAQYIVLEDQKVTLKFMPGEEKDEVLPTMELTFKLVEKPEKGDDYVLEFNTVNIDLCDEDGDDVGLDLLYADSLNSLKFGKLLRGGVGKTATVTFVAEDSCYRDEVEELMTEITTFSINDIKFAVDGAYWDDYLDSMDRALDVLLPLAQKLKYDSSNLGLMMQCAEYGAILDKASQELDAAEKNKEMSRAQIKRYHDIMARVASVL